MIKSIYSTGPYISISNRAAHSYVPASGTLWWDGQSQQMKVFDGQAYHTIHTGEATLNAPSVDTVIDWALKKMEEERRIKELAATHPGVKALADQVAEATEKMNAFAALVSEQNSVKG